MPLKRRWRNSLGFGLAALIFGAGAAAAEDQPVAALGDQPFEIAGTEGGGTLSVFASHPLLARMPGVTRLLVMLHGAARDADRAEAQGVAAIGAGIDQTLVVAPQFLSNEDVRRWVLPGDRLRWAGTDWADGRPAMAPAPISAVSALDSLVRDLAETGLLPDLKAITFAGQAEGADLAQLYAATAAHLGDLEARGIALRFVLAEPIHYLYFDLARPMPDAGCAGVDQWPYGLDGAPNDLVALGSQRVFERYQARDVVVLLDPRAHADVGPVSCAAATQGETPFARGRFYLAYLAKLAGAPVHRLAASPVEAPFGGDCGVAALLDRPQCPALAAAPAVPVFPEPPTLPAAPPTASPDEAPTPAQPLAAPSVPPPQAEPLPPPAPPEQVDPGGLADPLHDSAPFGALLTRPPPPPAKP